ncbi:HNH endonuclease [Treponema endosymbiont of Eucomonympha sp.]|uniref:HNH endonuclease n=1 Tax=Treponema endosymbiont of Eucomonympha sp. TaxID=1580831 RepID=UPI001650B969|nr:HNH endonuclease [Treponema endosymbiont of Eucomonympha sp.]
MSVDRNLLSLYTSIGKDGYGCMFSMLNTNYRALLAPAIKNKYGYGGFAQGFSVIEDVEGQDRTEWVRTNDAGQEIEKQHTVHMRKAVLFQVKDNAYYITHRGKVFKKMLLENSLTDNEKRLLCYLLILPSSFDEIKNYIFTKTQNVFESLEKQGVSEDVVLKSIEEIINWENSNNKKDKEGLSLFDCGRLLRHAASKKNKEDLFLFDYVYYDSFFINKANFLSLYEKVTLQEKDEFKKYISDSVKQLKGEYSSPSHNILSKKYVNGGVYTQSTLIENAWMLYVTKKNLNSDDFTSFEKFIDVLLESYGKLFEINKSNLKQFIYNSNGNRSVFQIIFCELFNIRVPLKDIAKDLTPEEISKYGTIDPTDESGYNQRELFASTLKKLAKRHSEFKCECEITEGCKYFTAKENGQTYLELHHFIPREFSNDFDSSIEILANYIALCPNCHRKIHLAVDNERKHLIRLLFNVRQESLKANKLDIDLTKLFEYYKIGDKE